MPRDWPWITSIVLAVVVVVVLLRKEEQRGAEGFAIGAGVSSSPEDRVISIYQQVLLRSPSPKELSTDAQQLSDRKITDEGLRQRLMDREEYQRLIKTQSNTIAPELPKLISERDQLALIARIYHEVRHKDVPPAMVLPLQDIYIHVEYNQYVLRVVLAHQKYPGFEKEVLLMQKRNKQDVIVLFDKTFGPFMDDIRKKAAALQAKDEADAAAAARGLLGAGAGSVARGIHDKDSDSSDMMDDIQCRASAAFDKDAAAKGLDDACVKPVRVAVRTHYGDMVLRPEFAWAVPQQAPPVCTTLGQKPLVQPLLMNSKLLLGTPLDDANDTQVGSIMPKFTYQEYVDVPPTAPGVAGLVPAKCKAGGATAAKAAA